MRRALLFFILIPALAWPQQAPVSKKQLAATMAQVRTGETGMVRDSAAQHLAELTRGIKPNDIDDETIKDLVSLLDVQEARYWVAVSLGNVGPRAKIAVPKLEKVLAYEECRGVSKSAEAGIRFALTRMGVTPPSAQCEGAAVPLDQEPLHHLFIDNATVRVFKVEVPAGGRTLMHQHDRDYLFVALGDSDVINARQNEPARELKLKDGDTGFTPGGFAHVAINNDKQKPFRNITVEIMKAAPDPNPEPSRMLAGAGMSVTWMVDNPRAFAELIELEPGATMPLHEHKRPHLSVPLTDSTLESDVAGKGKSVVTRKIGEPTWSEGGYSHTLRNTGTTRARWVQIEIK